MTLGQAIALCQSLNTRKPVTPSERTEAGGARLGFSFENPNGLGNCYREVDNPPTEQQIADLARGLPVSDEHRQDTVNKFRATAQPSGPVDSPHGTVARLKRD